MTIDIDELLFRTAEENQLPSIVLGVSVHGVLVSTHSVGTRRLGAEVLPDADTVFRIASMTKSFTAAAVLLLRDHGQLRLDDAVVGFLPWFDDPTVTVRHLLTMNAGFPTDDPWGDRHEPTPLAAFDALAASGIRRTHRTGTGFEYANLGYALLGRLISAVTGRSYTDFVEQEVVQPLGLAATRFDYRAIPQEQEAQGYAESAAGLRMEQQVLPGAFSPMGGLHSSVRDLTRWMGGYLTAFGEATAPHPLTAASRLEQQQPHTFARLLLRTPADRAPSASSLAYGFGLIAEEHSSLGRFVQHSGGYPGFGSHMRWHPATGIAVVALSNRTYAPMTPLAEAVMYDLVAAAPRAVGELWPETSAAMDAAEALLGTWDDELCDRVFAHNLDLDRDRSERRNHASELAQSMGAFSRDAESLESRSPAHARWRVIGRSGSARIEVLMSPDPTPRIQMLRYESEGN